MSSMKSRFALLALSAALFASAMHAQSTQGEIDGAITDKTGAVIQGVTLTATNTATGKSFTVTSNNAGLYTFPVLPIGTYTVTATKDGFQKLKEANVEVTVGGKVTFDLTMNVAGSEQTVEVTGEAAAVETTRPSQSSTVGERSIENLPTNGRNFIDFTLLTPGVNRDVRGGDLSFAGQRGTLNSLTIDGTDNNNTFFGQTLGRTGSGRAPYQFSEDSVAEFQVNTNGYSAEYGRAGGAVINAVTKSGTNTFHGSAFEFFRDRALNANDPIYDLRVAVAKANNTAIPLKPGYHFNQFGGTLGGPIVKNKLFFFFDYDGQRNNTGNPLLITLPTPTNAAQTAAVAYLQPRLNTYNRTFNQDVYLGKVDYAINQNNSLSVRYNSQRFTGLAQENSGTSSAFEHTGASNVATDTLSTQLTSTLSSAFVNTFRFGWQRDHEPGLANSINPEATITGAGGLTIGRNSFSPRETTLHRIQFQDTLTQVRGRHTLKYGADVLKDYIFNYFPGNFSGVYSFANLTDFGNSLLGNPVSTASGSTYTQNFATPGTTGPVTHPDLMQTAGFIQDDVRVNNNLTVNAGVRYDYVSPKQATTQNPAALAFGIDTAKTPTDHNNIAPRVGFAWTPFRDSSHPTVVRGGFGMFYGNTPSIMYGTALSNNGVNVVSYNYNKNNSAFLPTQNYLTTLCGPAVATPTCAPPSGPAALPALFVFAPKFVQPYTEQYNLGIEREVAKNLSVSVSYLGVQGHHLQRTTDINLPTTFTQVTYPVVGSSQTFTVNKYTGPRPVTGFGRIEQFQSTANSNYNGLILSANKRFANGFQFMTSYTFSRVFDDTPDATAVVIGADDAKENYFPTNNKLERAIGNNDVTHRFIASGMWDLDRYTHGFDNAFAKRVIGGWTLSGIFNAQTGQPYSSKIPTDLNNDGNTSSERVPGFRRNTNRLPNIYSFDPRITKNIQITERMNFQLIGEAFNVFNHSNITGANTALYRLGTTTAACGTGITQCFIPQQQGFVGTLSQFGVPTSASLTGQGNVGRVLQLAARFTF